MTISCGAEDIIKQVHAEQQIEARIAEYERRSRASVVNRFDGRGAGSGDDFLHYFARDVRKAELAALK